MAPIAVACIKGQNMCQNAHLTRNWMWLSAILCQAWNSHYVRKRTTNPFCFCILPRVPAWKSFGNNKLLIAVSRILWSKSWKDNSHCSRSKLSYISTAKTSDSVRLLGRPRSFGALCKVWFASTWGTEDSWFPTGRTADVNLSADLPKKC